MHLLPVTGSGPHNIRWDGFVMMLSPPGVPMHRLSWLGFTIDLELGLIMVPDKKIETFERKLLTAMEQPKLKARIIASLVGKKSQALVSGQIHDTCFKCTAVN